MSDLLLLTMQQRIVLSSWGGGFVSLEAATGEIAHSWEAGISPQAGASADTAGNSYCLRAVRGQGVEFVRVAPDGSEDVLDRQPENRRGASRMVAAAAPVLDEPRGVAYFVVNLGRDSALHAWSLRESRLLWRWSFPRMAVSTPALRADGVILLAGMDGAVHGVTAEGASLFRHETGAEYLLAGPVCDDRGTAFVGDPLGRLHEIDLEGTGRLVFEAARSLQARPSFDRAGQLHLPGTDRTVYVFQNREAA